MELKGHTSQDSTRLFWACFQGKFCVAFALQKKRFSQDSGCTTKSSLPISFV